MTTQPASQPIYPDQQADSPPTLNFYPAPEPDGSCILVFPGGGYGHVAVDHEGHPSARWLNTLGISAAVCVYRVAPNRHPIPLNDAKRAMRTVRAHAAEWKFDKKRIGVMGFSAGGHLAATLSTHFDAGNAQASDAIEQESCRPDLTILGYPVITLTQSYTHAGSRRNLLGDDWAKDKDLLRDLSPDQKVSPETPPAFLFHTVDDPGVKVENSLLYAAALRDHQIPHEVHLYEHGPHGVGLARESPRADRNDPVLATWTMLCGNWLKKRGFGRG